MRGVWACLGAYVKIVRCSMRNDIFFSGADFDVDLAFPPHVTVGDAAKQQSTCG